VDYARSNEQALGNRYFLRDFVLGRDGLWDNRGEVPEKSADDIGGALRFLRYSIKLRVCCCLGK
jgi:hypothetical protein